MPATDQTTAHSRRPWLILAVIAMAQLMVVLDATIVNIALPSAQQSLGFSDEARQWIVTAYALAFGGLLLLGGRLGDVFGRKRMFTVGMVGFAAASALGGFAQSFGVLVAARGLQGMFAALLAPAALSLLTTTFTEPRDRAKAFGVFGAIAGSGAAIGLLLGGVLTEYLNWRWCLYVNLLLAVPAVVAAVRLLPHDAERRGGRIDIPGALTASLGLFALVYGFSSAATHGWSAAITIGSLAAAAVLLVSFVVIELRVSEPLLPMRVVIDRARGGSYLAVAIVGTGMFGVFLFLTFYLQTTLHFSPVESGLAFLPMMATVMTTAMMATTRLVPRFGPRPLMTIGMLVAAAAMVDVHRHHAGLELRVARPARSADDGRRPRPRDGAGDEHRDGRRQAVRRGRRLGDGQHRPADRRVGRNRAAEHDRRQRGDELRGRQGADAGADGRRRRPRLHDRLLVLSRDLRRRRDRVRRTAAEQGRRDRGRRRAGVRALAARLRRASSRTRGCDRSVPDRGRTSGGGRRRGS